MKIKIFILRLFAVALFALLSPFMLITFIVTLFVKLMTNVVRWTWPLIPSTDLSKHPILTKRSA